MIADQWCETSWRAQPGSFVSLMTLYESNFVRLRWLVRDLRSITDRVVSKTASDCDLYLQTMELSRYTSVFRPPCEFGDQEAGDGAAGESAACIRVPDLEVCVYPYTRLAEVRSF